MSNDTDSQIWIGDLDRYIDIDAISYANELDEEQDALGQPLDIDDISYSNGLEEKQDVLYQPLDENGNILLFAGQAITERELMVRGVTPRQWRWAQHEAETSILKAKTTGEIETAFLKAVITSGRRYAVARYARLERLSYASAVTATFPYGIRALLYQYMAGEPSLADISQRKAIQRALHQAASISGITAYERTALVRDCLHEQARAAAGSGGHLQLNKDGVGNILSLCRLHFSIFECHVQSTSKLDELFRLYDLARATTAKQRGQDYTITGKYIRNWKLQHLHPLIFFYPYCIRNSLARLTFQNARATTSFDHITAVNELALVLCGINLMCTEAKRLILIR